MKIVMDGKEFVPIVFPSFFFSFFFSMASSSCSPFLLLFSKRPDQTNVRSLKLSSLSLIIFNLISDLFFINKVQECFRGVFFKREEQKNSKKERTIDAKSKDVPFTRAGGVGRAGANSTPRHGLCPTDHSDHEREDEDDCTV